MIRFLHTVLAFMCCLAVSAKDFSFEGITYTVIDEEAGTVETKAGYTEIDEEEKEKHFAGNSASGILTLPETVRDGEKEYSLVKIGEDGFSGNTLLKVIMPETIEEIGSNAFYGCGFLSSVNLPNSLTKIGKSAFFSCFSLKSIEIPDNIATIEEETFGGCMGLEEVTFSKNLYFISESAFFMCVALTDIIIPESVMGIDKLAFWGCSGLKELTLPNSLIVLGDSSFAGCSNIENIYYNTNVPALTVSSAFSSDSYTKAILYVPFGALEKFESTYPWKLFLKIQEYDFSSKVEDIIEDWNNPVEYFNLNGMPVASPQRGQLLIRKQGNRTQKIVF